MCSSHGTLNGFPFPRAAQPHQTLSRSCQGGTRQSLGLEKIPDSLKAKKKKRNKKLFWRHTLVSVDESPPLVSEKEGWLLPHEGAVAILHD